MYLPRRFYIVALAIVAVTAAGYWWPWLLPVGKWLMVAFAVAWLVDVVLLWHRRGIDASRDCGDRMSNGDDNEVSLRVDSAYPMTVHLDVVDEIPHVFQRRDINFSHSLAARGGCTITYRLRPTRRGVYGFGHVRVFVRSRLGLVTRRFTCGEPQDVKVYPSYLMLNRYELLAMSNHLVELGIKRIRRAGNNTEFEQIKDYVQGDEYRAINWKASARRAQLMVNVYQDERSQQIYCLIDKGRVMQQAFEGMTLLDYAINATLVLSYVAVHKDDKAGLMTIDARLDTFVKAEKSSTHMLTLNEALYAQETTFGETDYDELCVNVNRLIGKRSLLVLFTNFTGLTALRRQLPYLQQLNRRHRLLVVFFDDAELNDYIAERPTTVEGYYRHVIAEKMAHDKRVIVTTLKQQGIYSLLTTPQNLSIDVINRYLEMKSRHLF